MNELSTVSLCTTAISGSNGTGNSSFTDNLTTLGLSLTFVSLIISVLGLAGNGIVLWFLGFKIKRNKFTVYILNLAIADFLFLLCSFLQIFTDLPTSVIDIEWNLSNLLTAGYILVYNTGLYLLTAISLERCLSVLYPLWYRCQRPKHQSTIVCVLLWVLSCLVSGIEYFLCLATHLSFALDLNQYQMCKYTVLVSIGILTYLFFAPLMVFSNLTLFIKIRKGSQHRHPPKLFVVILVTVLIFLIFALPYRLVLIMYEIYYDFSSYLLVHSTLLLSVINSAANPYVYFLVGRQNKQRHQGSIKVALQMVFKHEMEEEMSPSSIRVITKV
ncbi:proto-oncogene Mas-like [Rhinatrema bivittatum]|uniref:proto-oncogene Mas-like n=1 Tax=Rhinatrema bivittatum TaxID=194408 RepID=UPI00112A4F65|nr:proto-oncogene Mas-like [Rhinatrema bivittatum]